jgi:hypothetical protein
MRWGTIDFARTGKVTWRDEEKPRLNIRVVRTQEEWDAFEGKASG